MSKSTTESRARKARQPRRAKGTRCNEQTANLSKGDPLLNLKAFAVEGAGGRLTNADVDRILYRKP